MRFRARLPMVVLTTGITCVMAVVVSAAQRQNNQQNQNQKNQNQQNQQNQKAVAAASEAAMALQKQATEAQQRLVGINTSITAAKAARDEAAKAKKAIEDGIIDGQASDSAFGQVRDQYRAADKAYLLAQKTVKESPEYQEKLQAARDSDDSLTLIPALKKEFDNMPEIAGARSALQEVKDTYLPLETKLLEADPKWVEADKDLKDKEKTLSDLNRQFTADMAIVNRAKAMAKQALANAQATAAAAMNNGQNNGQNGGGGGGGGGGGKGGGGKRGGGQ